MKATNIKTCKQFNSLCEKFSADAAALMKEACNNPRLQILDSDNIMDYNEGYLNIMFSGDDCEESFLFIDGILDSSTYIA
jgi:hypothetical protein